MSRIGALARAAVRPGGLDKLVFIAGLCLVAYFYGVATIHWKVFPFQLFDRAQLAWDAWRHLEPEWQPDNVLSWEAQDAATFPVQTLSPKAGDEALMMTGGFYERLEDCPKFGCFAWLMDRSGKVLHVWPAPDPKTFFAGVTDVAGRAKPNNYYLIGAALGSDGSLVATFHGRNTYPYQIGIAKFDKNGELLWKHFNNSHHWPTVVPDGRIFVPFVKIAHGATFADTMTPNTCFSDSIFSEGVRIIGPDGQIQREFLIADALAKADYPGVAYAVRDGCDPYHVNGVALLNKAAAERIDAREGDLLVSLREPSALVVLDQDTGAIERLLSGRSSGQHSPRVLPDGRFMVFDNLGGKAAQGGSRILVIDPATNASKQVYPAPGARLRRPFYSQHSGVVSANDEATRILISSSKQGQVIEADLATGTPLWTYDYVTDLADYLRAAGGKSASSKARVTANGAYYVSDLSFLSSDRPPPK